jgi:DNA sulfur modification protein DndD
MMILKKMELENFLPFYLRTEIDFSPKGGNKIVLLKGKNGAGKSSTFAALNFVFFGSPVVSAEKDEPLKIYDLVNTKKMTESDGVAFVRVHFDHESENWSFMRKIKFKKIDDTRDPQITDEEYADKITELKKKSVSDDGFIAVKNGTTQTWPSEPFQRTKAQRQLIEDIIPKESSKYYFFDGEEISKYTTVPPEDSIKNLIEKLLGIKEIKNAIEDLEKLKEDKYDKRIRKLGREISATESDARAADERKIELDYMVKEQEELEREIEHQNRELLRYDRELAETEKIAEKLDELTTLKKELEEAEGNIIADEKIEREFHGQYLPILISVEFLHKLNKKQQLQTGTPRHIVKTAEECLDKGQCICKGPYGVNERDSLKRLTKTRTSTLQNFEECKQELGFSFGVDSLKNRWATLVRDLTDHRQSAAELNREIKEINSVIDEQAGKQQEDIRQTREDQNSVKKLNQEKIEELKNVKSIVSTRQDEYNEAFEKVKHSSASVEQTKFNAYSKRCQQMIDALETVKENVIRIQKKSIEDFATEILKKIAPEKAGLQGITLDERYTIMIKRPPTGKPQYTNDSPRPSKGEKQIIAMAFVLALTKFAGIERPIFIDTPFARLDNEYTAAIAGAIIEQDEQVVILYQPGELNIDGIQQFKAHSSAEWEFDKMNLNYSQVKESI